MKNDDNLTDDVLTEHIGYDIEGFNRFIDAARMCGYDLVRKGESISSDKTDVDRLAAELSNIAWHMRVNGADNKAWEWFIMNADNLDITLRSCLTAPKPAQWMPIESGPIDIRVLVWGPELGYLTWTNHSDEKEWPEGATHWKPVDEPPASEAHGMAGQVWNVEKGWHFQEKTTTETQPETET